MLEKSIETIINQEKSAFYVFDARVLRERVRYLKSRLPEKVELCYAVKANTFISKEIGDEVERFEICSPGEKNICDAVGIDSRKMVISGIYKTPGIIEEMAADNTFEGIFTAESLVQYKLLCELSVKYGRRLKVLLRLTNDSQFGMNSSDIEAIIADREAHGNIDHVGIQYFSGTQKTSIKKFRREIEHLDAFLIHLKENYGFEADELEYGTGFPVSYFESDELDEEALLSGFSELIDNMTSKPRIILELGRSIAASCGRYFTHIVDIKQNKGVNYALIDGGMHHLVYFGQHMAIKHPFMHVVGKEITDHEKMWTICGSLCSMNDIVVKQIALPDIEIGDAICFENAGAYCMIEGISLFLSRDLPSIYLVRENGEIFCLRQTFETEVLNTPKYERMF